MLHKHHTNYKSMRRIRPGTKEERTRSEVSAAQSHHSRITYRSARTESSTLKSVLLDIPPAGVLYQTSFTFTERQHSLLCRTGKRRRRRVQMWTLQKNDIRAQLVSCCYNVKTCSTGLNEHTVTVTASIIDKYIQTDFLSTITVHCHTATCVRPI